MHSSQLIAHLSSAICLIATNPLFVVVLSQNNQPCSDSNGKFHSHYDNSRHSIHCVDATSDPMAKEPGLRLVRRIPSSVLRTQARRDTSHAIDSLKRVFFCFCFKNQKIWIEIVFLIRF